MFGWPLDSQIQTWAYWWKQGPQITKEQIKSPEEESWSFCKKEGGRWGGEGSGHSYILIENKEIRVQKNSRGEYGRRSPQPISRENSLLWSFGGGNGGQWRQRSEGSGWADRMLELIGPMTRAGWRRPPFQMVPSAECRTVTISAPCCCWRDCVNLSCECRSGWSCKSLPGWDDNLYLNLCSWPWQGITYWIPREAFISPASFPAVSEQGSCFRALWGNCDLSSHFPQQLTAKPHVSLAYGVRDKEITKLVSYQPRCIQDILCTSSARGLMGKHLLRIKVSH